MKETERIRQRYDRRKSVKETDLYSPLNASVYLTVQEKERAIISIINLFNIKPVQEKTVLEIGCGSGSNLLDFIRIGFAPENLVGVELLEDRASLARSRLPSLVKIIQGDACEVEIPGGPFDIVLQSTVFTSILDDEFQKKLAHRMWSFVKKKGGVLWYDFIYNNPRNPDVRGVPLKRIKYLFPEGEIYRRKITLAPPISRLVTRIHPFFYHLFNLFPFLRTHLLCWIRKPISGTE